MLLNVSSTKRLFTFKRIYNESWNVENTFNMNNPKKAVLIFITCKLATNLYRRKLKSSPCSNHRS